MRGRRLALSAALAGVVAWTAPGCDSEVEALARALGEGCYQNSDCDGGLVCVFRSCHNACVTSADCPLDAAGEPLRCVVGEAPTNVCQLDTERVCERASDCPPGQVCGLDDRCRDGCEADRDCVQGQVCRHATCAESNELSSDRISPAMEAPIEGKPCAYSSDCPPGPNGLTLACRKGQCTIGCYVESDCPRFFVCSTADDPTTPGDCELIGPRGQLFCDPDVDSPDREHTCVCPDQSTATQICKADGSGYEDCPCP